MCKEVKLNPGDYLSFGEGYLVGTPDRGVIQVDNWKELQEELENIKENIKKEKELEDMYGTGFEPKPI